MIPEATLRDGTWYLDVPQDARVEKPVRIEWKFPEGGGETRFAVRVGKNATLVLIEELGCSSPPPPAPPPCALRLHSGQVGEGIEWAHSVEIFLEKGAELEFISEQMAHPEAKLTIRQRSHLGDNAKISWRNVTLGARELAQDLVSEVRGSDAVSEIDWMFYARDQENYSLTVRNIFLGRAGGGEITMKGIAEENGHVRCGGMIEIGPEGNQTDTYLTQEVLMLDKTSKVDAIPGLEIKTNDVRASHSATVTRVTDDDLFYFGTRAISEREARRMFVEGFLGDLAGRISSASAQKEVLAAVDAKYTRSKNYAPPHD